PRARGSTGAAPGGRSDDHCFEAVRIIRRCRHGIGAKLAGREGEYMRLEKLPAAMAKRLAELECPEFTTTPWVKGKPLRERRPARLRASSRPTRSTRYC